MIFRHAEFYVETDASTQFATIRDSFDEPCGTFQRKRVYEKGDEWTVYDARGQRIASGDSKAKLIRQFAIAMGR